MENLKEYISKLRYDFCQQTLDESQINKDPLLHFEYWFKQAVEAKVASPNAMILATATNEGKPSARVMLLRNFSETGFVFYTNYQSKKGLNMEQNPYAALTFFWPEMERQVRIEGAVEKQSAEESDEYFFIRPDGSKLGAWSSQQSTTIKDRSVLDEKYTEMQNRFKGQVIPRPPFWGGYNLKPTLFEFWQGRPSRMHDRIVYTLSENGSWKTERLSP